MAQSRLLAPRGKGWTVSTTNTVATQVRLLRFGTTSTREVVREVRRSAHRIQTRAYQLAPVRTGWLRDHIKVAFSRDNLAYEVGWDSRDFEGQTNYWGEPIDSPYFAYTEFGTVKMSPRPCLFPAVREEREVYPRNLAAVIAAGNAREARMGGRRRSA